MRVFVGIILPKEISSKIKEIQKEIEKMPIKCKMVEEYNLHICLSFLGEVEEKKVEIFKKILDSIATKHKKFETKIEKIKLIPNENFVRVIALDVNSEELEKIRREVESKIGGDSKPLHITLCRVKNISDKKKFFEKYEKIKNVSIGIFKVESLQIIKSILTREGPIYEIVHESKLLD